MSAICVVVVAIAPAAPLAGGLAVVNHHVRPTDHVWAATAIPQATLRIAGNGFRVSALSADGRVAVVADSRAVYLFRAASEGSWGSISKPTAKLRLPKWGLLNLGAVASSAEGTTVLVAVGAVGKHRSAVFVFHVSSPQEWKSSVTPTAKLTNAAEPTGFGSGVALSSDGTTALVGEPGGADVFHVATADSWRDGSTPTATLVADAVGAEEGGLSIAVALSADGTTALIGATSDYTFDGAAYVFHAAAADAWVSSATPEAALTDGFVGPWGDGFGGAVALSPDGMTALVGAPDPAFGPSGAAYVFQVRTPHDWTSTESPDAAFERVSNPYSSRKSGDVPGWSVAISEDGTALVGEPSVLGRHGAADVFRNGGLKRTWSRDTMSYAKLTNAASPPRDLFAAAVGISSDGTTALVSSTRATFIFTQAGSPGATHCYVPYVEGEKLPTATRAIESAHCRVGKVTSVSRSPAQSDAVISQRPKPGSRLANGAKITLRVSKRSER